MPMLNCHNCKKDYWKTPSVAERSRFCSRHCQREFHGWNNLPNASCATCGKDMHLKPSKLKKLKHQPTCSTACMAKYREKVYSGSKNPNYRARTENGDGYRVVPPYANGMFVVSDEKLMHKAVASETLGVRKIRGFHVHHRDCDVLNNSPENLAVLTASDHKWIHKQFGVATLWAVMKGKVSFDDLISWSDDRERASRLLRLCVKDQSAEKLGVVNDGTLSPRQS